MVSQEASKTKQNSEDAWNNYRKVEETSQNHICLDVKNK